MYIWWYDIYTVAMLHRKKLQEKNNTIMDQLTQWGLVKP